ncbi:receptor-like protein kinase FERONIA [Arachis stenosperma]|uniref:receptor-like protein kinase FERONIA n=1 Tax=Arachis stenosperma TaxID=217475 RepID=UPI0025AC6D52|nr:receptor-like protein kinase FERONIA [Arachis stenosperma]
MTTTRRRVGLRTTSTTDLFLLFTCLPFFVIIIAADQIYNPTDVYSISCGSSNNFTFDGRNWTSDINTKLLLETKNKTTSSSSVAVNALIPNIIQGPYTSARVSYSQFTYSFPVATPGQKFIRLFFNPTSYQNFDPTKAYFSVKSGDYTLLKDFNASLYADADDDQASDTFFREYSVYVQDGDHTLNLSFIPSTPINATTYYAFINGIEVVSMPPYLYHTNPNNDDNKALRLLGSTTPYRLENNSALETKYRFNVGDRIISPSGDTGMLRSWVVDEDYKTSPGEVASEFGEITKLNFSLIPNYTAPDLVYRTLRHMMRENATVNWSFNLTWELPVDSGFTYMLRLHFCELDPVIQIPGDRVFYIYIQDQMADDHADVLMWTNGQRGVPIVKDYAVIVPSDNQKNANISLKMHPSPRTGYVDAVLNGLELFKINDSYGNLAGPNPDPPSKAPSGKPEVFSSKNNTPTAAVAGAVSGAVLLLVIVVSVFFLMKRWRRKSGEGDYYNSSKHKSEGSSQLPTNLCRHFSTEEIRTATNNFDELFVIGAGGFGNVYKGYIDDGATPVAIKRLKPGSQQGVNEFLNEIEMLSQLRHLHLVSLIGYCCERNEMILVYDFMTRGTLRDHLYNTSDNPSLSWKQRLEICIGAARGLHYLHTGAKHMIIHRDVKSTNILLDERWVAKVSDFGLSRVGPTGTTATHVSTLVKGSVGYLDPEYYKRQRLTEKSDVYSFGVVLLEVLCGRAPLLRNVEKEQVSLVDWARRCYDAGSLGKIVDPKLKREISSECLKKFGDLAMSCLHDDGTQRPSMNDVVGVLEFVLQLQENSSIGGGSSEVFSSSSISDGGHAWDNNSKNSGVSMTTTTTITSTESSRETQWLMSENVFSEIGNPKGR